MINRAQLELIRGLQERMNIILDNYRKDPMYAPPTWTFENIWLVLNNIIRLSEDEALLECKDTSTFAAAPDSSSLD